MKTVVEVKQLKKIYGGKGNIFTALDDINFKVTEGEFVGIMGPSGAGKSTLLHILATIDRPTNGSIEVNGSDLMQMNEEQLSQFRRDQLGFIFQDYNLLDTLTVKENILLPLTLSNIRVSELEQRVESVASRFGITAILEKYPYQISGGERQRTAAARAIITNPSLILADEPTGALDSRSATDLLESLKSLNEQNNATIFMVTHDAYAASYCKRVLFIKDGKIFTELGKGNQQRKQYFEKILVTLGVLGGGQSDAF